MRREGERLLRIAKTEWSQHDHTAPVARIRATLIEQTLEMQAQANRLLHASPIHRGLAEKLRDQTRTLEIMLRDLQPTTAEHQTLDLFFPLPPTHGGRATKPGVFLHLPD